MTQKRPWTEEQDRLLKFVFESSKITKWSQISRRLQEEFGVKGRNGKQCKQRYTSHIDTSHPKQDWNEEENEQMFNFHNELGNKWAVIGSKLGGKSDNCVKNHFYSLLRKALRKINKVVHEEFRRQIKEIKPNVLYRIVQVSEERFKLGLSFEKQFVCFSNDLKNQLLQFCYDPQDQEEEPASQLQLQAAKKLIDKIGEFNISYKKKAKKERKSSGQQQDLLTPHRYNGVKRSQSQFEDSEVSSSFCNSEENGACDISEDDINRSIINKKTRRNSADTAQNTLEIPGRIRTRANSQDGRIKSSPQPPKKEEKQECFQESGMQVQQMLNGLQILEQDDLPPHPLMMKKQTSKYSRYSEGMVEKEQYHFFEQSNMEMRILPEMTLAFKESQIEENIFH